MWLCDGAFRPKGATANVWKYPSSRASAERDVDGWAERHNCKRDKNFL